MKKFIFSSIAISLAALALTAFNYPSFNNPQDKPASPFPAEVEKIFQVSCFDCHTDAASNAKAKMKLNFDKWGELSDAKKIGKMEAINDVIKKDDMPPAKYLGNHPEAKLNADQKAIVDKWVTEESKKLMGE